MPQNKEVTTNVEGSGNAYPDIIHTSLFLKRAQCPLWSYLELHNPELKEQRSIDSISPEPARAKLVSLARKIPLFEAENRNTVEVDFRVKFAGVNFGSSFDIVRKTKHRTECYTIKASSRILQTHILASAYAWYAAERADFHIDSVHIIHLNKKYTMEESPEPAKMFTIRNVTTQIKEMQNSVSSLLENLPDTLKRSSAPHVEIGPHCYSPSSCFFLDHCWKNVPDDSVFNIAGMDKQAQFEFFSKGIVSLHDVDIDSTMGLNESQRFQVEVFQGKRPYINEKKIQKFLNQLVFPVYFLDFEAFCPPVPIFENTSPFQFIPFQYSLHSLQHPEAVLQHTYYLASPEGDPREELLKKLYTDLGECGTVLIYGDELEVATLNQLKKFLPQYSEKIDNILERLVDFSRPFRKRYYYHPAMNGSYSIKKITPGLFKNISYKELAISHGGEAARAYEAVRFMEDPDKILFWESALKEYCKTDTFVMVELYRMLKKSME